MKRLLVNISLSLFAFVVLLELAVWIFSPWIFKQLSASPLSEMGLVLDEASFIRYNPFKSSLIINDFTIKQNDEAPLDIKSASIEIDLYQAIRGTIHVRQFNVDGLHLIIAVKDDVLSIAGFHFPIDDTVDESSETVPLEPSTAKLILPELSLTNSRITYVAEGMTQQVYIESLRVSDARLAQSSQVLNIDLKSEFQQSKIVFSSSVDLNQGSGVISSDFSMTDLNLVFLQPFLAETGVTLHSGLMSVRAKPTLNILNGAFDLVITELAVGFKKVNAEYQNQKLKTEQELTLSVHDIKLDENAISINSVLIESLKTIVELNATESAPEERIQGVDDKTINKDDSIQQGGAEASVVTPPFSFSINAVSFKESSIVEFNDNRVEPAYQNIFHIEKAQVLRLNNRVQDASPIDLIVRTDTYAKIVMSGQASIFSDVLNLELDGSLAEVSLPSVSPYLKQSIGFEMGSGQLDSQLKVVVKEGVIDGNVQLHLRGLKMERADAEQVSTLQAQTSVPLNYALSMLQDKQGNVQLSIPLSGSVDDPNFGVGSFVSIVTKKAIMAGAKSYLMKTFIPYSNVVSVAMAAGDQIFKLRFNDLTYASEQIKMEAEQQQYLDQFVALMKKKEKAQVKICGVATTSDIAGLPTPLEKSQKDYKEHIAALKLIATQRAENFKAMAVEVGGLASARMLICSPSVDLGKNATAKIQISI